MRKMFLIAVVCFFTVSEIITADEISFSVEVNGITVNGGTVYGALYSNNNAYRENQPEFTFSGNSTSGTMIFNLQIPQGEYVIRVYQDVNNNGQLDRGLFGIPKEPYTITNYNGGIPGNFDKHKVTVNNRTIITVSLRK